MQKRLTHFEERESKNLSNYLKGPKYHYQLISTTVQGTLWRVISEM
jgi:hypothetical protein